jgi:hypothetical protein
VSAYYSNQRSYNLVRTAGAFFCAAWLAAVVGAHESSSKIVRIEEDWEMNVIEPAPENNSPQVTFFVNPGSEDHSVYFQVQMNYATNASFSGGGFHVAAVSNETYVDQARSGNHQGLSVDQDTIHWTNVMVVADEKLLFAIKNGHGSDWGNFGGPEFLVEMPARNIDNLNDYRPQRSVDEVDIGFGGNRVSAIELKAVRVFYSDGRVVSESINRFVER